MYDQLYFMCLWYFFFLFFFFCCNILVIFKSYKFEKNSFNSKVIALNIKNTSSWGIFQNIYSIFHCETIYPFNSEKLQTILPCFHIVQRSTIQNDGFIDTCHVWHTVHSSTAQSSRTHLARLHTRPNGGLRALQPLNNDTHQPYPLYTSAS